VIADGATPEAPGGEINSMIYKYATLDQSRGNGGLRGRQLAERNGILEMILVSTEDDFNTCKKAKTTQAPIASSLKRHLPLHDLRPLKYLHLCPSIPETNQLSIPLHA
jgi:hypothetical protein